MSAVKVIDKTGKSKTTLEVDKSIVSEEVNAAVIHQALTMYRANQRQGNASTKERADVSGGGKKPFKQKGTGRARAGSTRSPLWIGGGTVFGPHPRDFRFEIPKKVKKQAFKEVLSAKIKDEQVFCLDIQDDTFSKTKEFATILSELKIRNRAVFAVFEEDNLQRVARNIRNIKVVRVQDLNTYDMLQNKYLFFTTKSWEKLVQRIS